MTYEDGYFCNADVKNQRYVIKSYGSEWGRESKSEVSMSREETELLVQKQREENAEANCECSFIQAVQGKTYENQTKQANFISTLFLFFFVLENLFFFF